MRRSFFTLPVLGTATCGWLLLGGVVWLKDYFAVGITAQSLQPANLWLMTQSNLNWAVFSLLILEASQRLEFEKGRRIRVLAIHLALASLLAAADVLLDMFFDMFTRFRDTSFGLRFFSELFINVFSYALVAAVGYALIYHQRLADSRLRATELQRQLAQARLDTIARTLQPHFLFNSLNSVAALVRLQENQRALQAVVALGDLLRTVLQTRGEALVPLNSELEFIERYLAVERLRFEEHLRVEYDIQEEVRQKPVPALILQPLVENAIRHGVENCGHGRVKIEARNGAPQKLTLVVGVHDLVLVPDAKVTGLGIGLDATRQRLTFIYGPDRFSLELLVCSRHSTVTLQIPDDGTHTDSHRG
jgi:two-component system LytT family sensor kinase